MSPPSPPESTGQFPCREVPGWSTGQAATLACVLESLFAKPGNVHRGADFPDTTLQDFLVSGILIGPAMDVACQQRLGRTVLAAAEATRQVVRQNTNLGIILLFAPLATVDRLTPAAVLECVGQTDRQDCRDIYRAIQLASPGGLGEARSYDVQGDSPPERIQPAMAAAAGRDMIARQYINGCHDVLEFVKPAIGEDLGAGHDLQTAVIRTHVRTMHRYPDSLIARKTDQATALEAAARAGRVLAAGSPGDETYWAALADLDFWLRSDGNRRNPGTTADLVAAGLFAGLRDGTIQSRHLPSAGMAHTVQDLP